MDYAKIIKNLKIENTKLLLKIIRNYSLKALIPVTFIANVGAYTAVTGRIPFYQEEYLAHEIKTSIYNEENLDNPVVTSEYQRVIPEDISKLSKIIVTSPYTKTDEGYESYMVSYYLKEYNVEDVINAIEEKDINLIMSMIDKTEIEVKVTGSISVDELNNSYKYQAELVSGEKTTGIIQKNSLENEIEDTILAIFCGIVAGAVTFIIESFYYRKATNRDNFNELWIDYDIKQFKKEIESNNIIIEETEKKYNIIKNLNS